MATILPCCISTSAFHVRSAVTMVPFLMTLVIFLSQLFVPLDHDIAIDQGAAWVHVDSPVDVFAEKGSRLFYRGKSNCFPAIVLALWEALVQTVNRHGLLPGAPIDDPHSTIPAVSTTAWNSTSAPAAAHSLEISSASLWLRPPTQGHMTMVAGATLAAQQASWPAPEMMFMWL